MHFVCAYSVIWKQAGHQFTVYMETVLQQQGFKFHTKMAWTIPEKKRGWWCCQCRTYRSIKNGKLVEYPQSSFKK